MNEEQEHLKKTYVPLEEYNSFFDKFQIDMKDKSEVISNNRVELE